MNKLLKVFISVLALGVMASVTSVQAQTPPAGGQGGGQGRGGRGGGRGGNTPEMRYAAIETAVGKLTDDQKTKIMAILTKAAADTQALPQEDRRGPKAQEMRTATNKEIRALLTEEQAKKFDAMPQGGRGGGGGRQGGGQRRGN